MRLAKIKILLTFAPFLVGVLVSCADDLVTITPTSTSAPTSTPSTFIYSTPIKEKTVSLEAPIGWKAYIRGTSYFALSESGRSVPERSFGDGRTGVFVEVFADPVRFQGQTVHDYVDRWKKNLSGPVLIATVHEQIDTKVDGHDAIEVVYSVRVASGFNPTHTPDTGLRVHTFVEIDGIIYDIALVTPGSPAKNHRPVYDRAVASFRVD